MEVDTNELLHRIGAVLRGISKKLDRLIEIGERPAREIQVHEMLEDSGERQTDHFAGADKMVGDEPAKQPGPEHPAGPKPDPGEGYRILSKDPPEDLTPGDEFENGNGEWIRSSNAETTKKQGATCWYRRKIEVAKEAEPAWEPKVGDWVRVTRPSDWEERDHPCWAPQMHQFDGKVGKIESEREGRFHICGFAWHGLRFVFHRNWLSPADPPKPAEPEYREPVLPADAGQECEFSDDSISWEEGVLIGWRANFNTFNWKSERDSHRYARIKVDA